MNINNISDYSQLEVSKENISQKLNQIITKAQNLNSENHNFIVYYNERTACIKEHLNGLINNCDEYLDETFSSNSLDELITEHDLDFLEAGIIFFELKINKHLEAKSVEPFSSVNFLPEQSDTQVKPLIPEDLDELFEMSNYSVDPITSEGPELIDLDRPDGDGELKGEWFRHAKENTRTYTEAEKEGEKKGLMKMRKWRWLAVAQLPASYPYAVEAYEFYKPYAIDAYNTTIQMYNTYAPQVLETVSGWFN